MTMKRWIKFFLILSIFGLVLPVNHSNAAGNTYYVSSQTGSDSYSGTTPLLPLATVDAVNHLDLQPGDSVLFFCGETWRGTPLTIKDSGAEGSQITISSYPSGCADQPVISGAQPVSGWYQVSGNLYAANLNSGGNAGLFGFGINQVFDGETRLLLGRWPNLGTADGGYSTIDSASGSQISDTALPVGNWNGASVHIRGMRWYILNRQVSFTSGSTLTLNANPGCWGGSCSGWGFFINDHLNTLDQEGEWFYDQVSGVLYLYTTAGKPQNGQIEASVILKEDDRYWGGINLGRDLNYEGIHHVTIENLNVQRWYKHGISMPTNYAHQESHHLTLKNNTIQDLDGIGISLAVWVWGAEDGRPDGWRGGHNLLVEGNLIERVNWKGIDTYSRESQFVNNTIREVGLVQNLGASGLGCSLTAGEGACTEDGDGFRIKVGNSSDSGNSNLVQGNKIEKTAYNGMDIFGHSNTIRQNVFVDTCYVKGDCGAVRTFGRDNLSSTPVYDLVFEGNIINNVIGNTDGCRDDFDVLFGFGLYIDHYSRNITINDNTIMGATVHGVLYQNSTGQMRGNTLYGNSRTYPYIGAQVYLGSSPTYVTVFEDNIVYALRSGAYTLAVQNASVLGSADHNFYFNPYNQRSVYLSGAKTLSEWQATTGKDANSSQAWFFLDGDDEPLSTLFLNQENTGKTINLGELAYLDVSQQAFYGTLYLPPYHSKVLIKNGLAPLSLSSIFPNMVEAGAADFELQVRGTGFTDQSVVRVDGVGLATTFIDTQNLSIVIPAALVSAIDQLSITVYDPLDGGFETTVLDLWVVDKIYNIHLPVITQ